MIKPKSGNWPVLAAALLCLTACEKKNADAPAPVLSAPGAAEKVAAQAEVKSSSGPIELSLLLHKTEIKVGDYLWARIRIRNISDKKIISADRAFHDARALRKQSGSRFGVYLEMHGPGGKAVDVEYATPSGGWTDIGQGVSGFLEVDGLEEQAMVDGWKKQGLDLREINVRLYDHNSKKRPAAESRRDNAAIELLPGQSVETKSAFFYSMQDKIHDRPRPRRLGDFAQLDFFVLDAPGKYKIRAVYDLAPTETSMKIDRTFRHSQSPVEVLVRTPWVSIEVRP